ncbi:MAG: DUF2905 domain-containing protein [Candidatus Kapaibacteriales bacterium]
MKLEVGKILIILGLILIVIGLLFPYLSKIPFGRLPGDIIIERPNLKIYIPLVSMLILSLILSLLLWLFKR